MIVFASIAMLALGASASLAITFGAERRRHMKEIEACKQDITNLERSLSIAANDITYYKHQAEYYKGMTVGDKARVFYDAAVSKVENGERVTLSPRPIK